MLRKKKENLNVYKIVAPEPLSPPVSVQERRISPVERLLEQLNAHIAGHQAWLDSCHHLHDRITDPASSMLVEHIVGATAGHRRLLVRMAMSLRDALQWTHSPDALPHVQPGGAAAAQRTQAILRELLEREGKLGRESRKLACAYAGINSGLEALLLETMALDGYKHERVLRFVLQLLEASTDPLESAREDRPTLATPGILEEAAELVREPVRASEALGVSFAEEEDWRR